MKTVTAFEDERGVLHRSPKAARDADGRKAFEDALKACTAVISSGCGDDACTQERFDLDRFIKMIQSSPLLRETVVSYLSNV